jgi:hypothetical protein
MSACGHAAAAAKQSRRRRIRVSSNWFEELQQ